MQALADDFEAHGKGVVEKVRTDRPQDYLKIVASVMRDAVSRVGSGIRAPKLLNLNANTALAGVNG